MTLYFDWNATTPPLPEALAAMDRAARETWANPASVHSMGRAARACVEEARHAVAELAELGPFGARDVVLTSGGTEANNLAMSAPFAEANGPPRTIVTSRLEHPSVVAVALALERAGRARVRFVRVRSDGALDLPDLEEALLGDDVALVAVQTVNHETGVVHRDLASESAPLFVLLRAARERGIWVHEDAVQAWGKLDVRLSPATSRSLAGHKFRGPKGIGALVLREGVKVPPLLRGGAQERGIRPGTVDPVAAAGLAVALRHARAGAARYRQLRPLRDHLEHELIAMIPGAAVNGALGVDARAPHVSNMSFPGWDGPELVAAFDLEGLCVSSGSACSAGTSEPSPVITAMQGVRARHAVRFSLGETTTRDMVDAAIAVVRRVLGRASAHI